jgi:hypothetical protein
MTATAEAVRFDIGRVFRNGFAIVARRPLTLLMIGAILTFPTAVLSTWLTLNIVGPTPQGAGLGAVWLRLGKLELIAVAAAGVGWIRLAAVALVAAGDSVDGKVEIGALVTKLASRLPGLYLLGALTALATALGLVLLVVPGVILSLAWSMGPAVGALEDRGFVGVLSRSAELTRGCRAQLFVVFLVYGIAAAILGVVVRAIFGGPLLVSAGASPSFLSYVILPAVGAVTGPIEAAITTAAYFELRTVKEGLASQGLAAIFN